MKCLFCKSDASKSISVEHIIPESLGNRRHTLPPGIVCDKCNNYFARKVEKPFLDSPGIRILRFNDALKSKKRVVPPIKGTLTLEIAGEMRQFPVRLHKNPETRHHKFYAPTQAINQLKISGSGSIIFPTQGPSPEKSIASRFLAKVSLEALAHRMLETKEGPAYIIDNEDFDAIRKYVREGHPKDWPFHERRIYPEGRKVSFGGSQQEILYEFDFLITQRPEMFFILALLGVEYTINLGGPSIQGYMDWLNENADISPLYQAGSKFEDRPNLGS